MRNVETAVPLRAAPATASRPPPTTWERAGARRADPPEEDDMRARDHVGELRPSQLLHTYGVGATVELPEMTTLVLGLDDWPQRARRAGLGAAAAGRRARHASARRSSSC